MRILTSNRATGTSWVGRIGGRGFRPRWPDLPRRSVRRLMKVDPQTAKGTPDAQILTRAGVAGRSGPSPVGTRLLRDRATPPYTGKKAIRNQGANKELDRN